MVKIRFSVWFVSVYAHVDLFVTLFVFVITLPISPIILIDPKPLQDTNELSGADGT